MTMQEGSRALGEEAAVGRQQDRAYLLDLLGDSLNGLGRYEAAVEAYREAAQELKARGARCSYSLCLLKIADNYLSLHEPWHAIGYLQACVPLLREMGLDRHVRRAQRQLAACQAELARGCVYSGRDGPVRSAPPPPAAPSAPPPPAATSAPPPPAARSAAPPPVTR
jgi:tetratricopeptide (TPR) repeat protein